jgi:PTS system mannose-specific IIB component
VRGAKKLSNSVYLTEEGVKALKKIHKKGIKITCRMLPKESNNEFWPVIEKNFPDWV